ncbi:MAG: AtpZ/AtpI family protein [Myxococcota bacterium]
MIDPDSLRRAGSAIALASALPFFTIAAGALGAGLDRLLGTGSTCTVLGALIGFAAGVYQLFRGMQQQTPPDDHPHDPPP